MEILVGINLTIIIGLADADAIFFNSKDKFKIGFKFCCIFELIEELSPKC